MGEDGAGEEGGRERGREAEMNCHRTEAEKWQGYGYEYSCARRKRGR